MISGNQFLTTEDTEVFTEDHREKMGENLRVLCAFFVFSVVKKMYPEFLNAPEVRLNEWFGNNF